MALAFQLRTDQDVGIRHNEQHSYLACLAQATAPAARVSTSLADTSATAARSSLVIRMNSSRATWPSSGDFKGSGVNNATGLPARETTKLSPRYSIRFKTS